MSVAIRAITRLQDADDINASLGAGVDEYTLVYDHDTTKFVLRAPVTGYLLATGAVTGATSQAQNFTVGVTVGSVTTPATLLQVAETSTASPRGIMSSQHNTGTDGARFHMRKSRGTNAAPVVVVTGDMLGRLVASGYDGANYLEMGSIDIVSAGTIASTRVPTEIRFSTATDAAPSVLTQRMVIDKAGNVGIGTASPATALHVVGAATVTAGIRPAVDGTTALALSNVAGDAILTVDTSGKSVNVGGIYLYGGTTKAIQMWDANGIRLSYVSGNLEYATFQGGTTWVTCFRIDHGAPWDVFAIKSTGLFGVGTNSPATKLHVLSTTAVTNALRNVLTLGANVTDTGVGAAGLGAGLLFTLETTTTVDTSAASVQAIMYEATHSTRKFDLVLNAYDTAIREGLRIRGNGSAPAIGFLGATPQARIAHVADANVAYAAGDLDTEAEVIAALNTTNGKINNILATLELFGLHATA